jgi:hypothetical protein
MVYDITSPWGPQFVQYVNNRDFSADIESVEAGDLGPEGMTFFFQDGQAYMAVGNEISGSTTIYPVK